LAAEIKERQRWMGDTKSNRRSTEAQKREKGLRTFRAFDFARR
jgi:hypothetical protein